MEAQADSQKLLLSQYGHLEEMTEQLSISAQHGDTARVHELLKQGLSPNHFDSAGFLPLHYACARGHGDVARLLLEFGSDHSAYLTGYSPMELSARSGSLDIMKDLLYFGADVEEAGQGGRPPLVSAAAHQHLDVMKLLLDNGANINSRDVKGNTALHEAVRLKDPVDFIYLLLRRGADSKLSNMDEKNPMEVRCTCICIYPYAYTFALAVWPSHTPLSSDTAHLTLYSLTLLYDTVAE
jgi:ankyrin repeat protein